MDKVKLYFELARKHHFWVLCGIAAVAGLVAWYLSSGKLVAEFKANSQTIDSTFASLKSASAATDQPHDGWAEGQNKETNAVAQDVLSAWKALYQEQKEKVFVWPKDLSQDFLDAANQLTDPNAVIPRKLREYYQSMVKQQVDHLADIVDAAPLEEIRGGNAPEQEHSVDWAQNSQQEIEQSFDWTERPSTLLIKYAQEELWVYQALCNVIKSANEGSTGSHDAIIQEINAMDIAYNAVEDAPGGAGQNRVESITASGASAPGPPGVGGGPGGSGNSRPDPKTRGKREAARGSFSFGPGGGEAGAASANPDDLWKSYRYINPDGTPKTAADVDGGAGEFNLMPFRLLLKMDSRYIDKLLVAFRNSDLPFEVQQVRINPEHTAAASSGGGGRFARSGPMGPPSGPGGPPGGGGPGRMPTQRSSGGEVPQHDRNVTVEIRGVAYLLKPPDLQKLHIAPSTETPPTDASVAPAGAGAPATAQVEATVVGGVIKQVGDQPAAAPTNNPATSAPPPAAGQSEATPPTTPPTAAATDATSAKESAPGASPPAGTETSPPAATSAQPATP
jgi:hypothetical protein